MNRAALFVLTFFASGAALALVGCGDSPEETRQEAPNAAARGEDAKTCLLVASILREPFHHCWCKWAVKISDRNLAGYNTREDAIADGHRPCKVCNP